MGKNLSVPPVFEVYHENGSARAEFSRQVNISAAAEIQGLRNKQTAVWISSEFRKCETRHKRSGGKLGPPRRTWGEVTFARRRR
mmetsp:Transcript_37916/g.100883  ORF Transcript_37916/g.100883 Transcript_37916/m.100883 type:complete len:84 (+) Transcript_37916:539-790(+)